MDLNPALPLIGLHALSKSFLLSWTQYPQHCPLLSTAVVRLKLDKVREVSTQLLLDVMC